MNVEEKREMVKRLKQFNHLEIKIEELKTFKENVRDGLSIGKIITSGGFGGEFDVPSELNLKLKDFAIEMANNQISAYEKEMEEL